MTFPTNLELVPSVAELPICQNTLQACAPFTSVIVLPEAVMSVEFERKTKTAPGSFSPSSTRDPVSERVEAPGPAYTPGTSVSPPRSAAVVTPIGRPAASLYAEVTSACACAATGFASCCVAGGIIFPGGNPVTAEPGETPRFSGSVLGPVLVTVAAARTEKFAAVPIETVAVAARARGPAATPTDTTMTVAAAIVAKALTLGRLAATRSPEFEVGTRRRVMGQPLPTGSGFKHGPSTISRHGWAVIRWNGLRVPTDLRTATAQDLEEQSGRGDNGPHG